MVLKNMLTLGPHISKCLGGMFLVVPVIRNLPANVGDMGSNPGLGGSHMPTKQLSLQVTTTEALVPKVCSTTREVTTVRSSGTTTRE